jgi:hypothetical protein
MNSQIQYAKRLVKEKKVKQISETLFEVEEHKVKIQKKKGRTLLICDCYNDTKFCIESPFCVHKLAVINFLCDNTFYKELDKLIELYKGWVNIKIPIKLEILLNDLENLKRLR